MSIGELTVHSAMRKKRGPRSALFGVILGFVGGFFISNFRLIVPLEKPLNNDTLCGIRSPQGMALGYSTKNPMDIVKLRKEDTVNNSATNLIFVGVMTARKYLDTRAKAVFETWGSELPGKIAFFSSEISTVPENCPDLPLVALPHVDDSYPPQKKSFLMLQYMWQNFGDKFEWFLRADDDVYVRTDRLEKLLRSVDSKLPRYIGQAGRGNSEEIGLLSLEYDENFCMGGPGVILSRETLRRVVPHIKHCLKNLYTTHEDVELGRCVQKYAEIPCTWSYEMQSILYHNSSGDQAFTGNLKRKEVHRAITLHPVKSPPYMYRLHNYMRGLRIQELQHLKVQLHRDIQSMMAELDVNRDKIQDYNLSKNVPLFPEKSDSDLYLGDNKVLGVPAGLRAFRPKKASEVIPWDFLSRSEYSLLDINPRRRIHSDVKEGLEDITREVMASINAYSRQRGRVVEERSVLYGYRRVDAYGADTILDLLLVYRKYRGRIVTLLVRRHVYVHQHFTGLEIREVVNGVEVKPNMEGEEKEKDKSLRSVLRNSFLNLNFKLYEELDPIQSKIIHFILPLSGRLETFKRFLKIYEQICLVASEKTELMIILFPHEVENTFNETIALVNKLKYKYPSEKIDVIPSYKNFSRALALEIGVSECKNNDLLFFIDVDIVFTNSALHRIRLNTILQRQLYFPIVFSQFDPKIVYEDSKQRDSYVINNFNGYWREYGFGIASLYKIDFRLIGGFDLSIRGWGKEDVDLFEKAVRSNLTIFRAVDRHLIHVFHDVECDPSLAGSQLIMCQGSRANTYAGTEQLANIIYQHPEYLKYAKNLRTRTATPAA